MTGRHTWQTPLLPLSLPSDTVHVWRAALDQPVARIREFAVTLDAEEHRLAEAFCFDRHYERFIVGRGLLRTILAGYLGVPAGRLRFHYGPQGKPRLAEDFGPLRFNLAHSEDLALFAVAWNREIGVDLERVRLLDDADQIATSLFSPHEIATLRAQPAEQRLAAFFRCWTRKEAYIKARGEGISIPLDQFDVSLSPDEPVRILQSRVDPRDTERWLLAALYPAPGYTAALAVEGHDWRLACWQWPSYPSAVCT